MTERFFNSYNRVEGITEGDYDRVPRYIEAVEAIARVTYNSVYIIDYHKKNFLYVSGNPLFLCGLTPEEVKEMGYRFYTGYVPEDEVEMLLKINSMGFRFFNGVPMEERRLYYISYDFHIGHKGDHVLVNHKLTPLAMAPDGHIWLAACYVSISNHDSPGNVEIRKEGAPEVLRYDLDTDRLFRQPALRLTDREKEVLLLSARGLTVDEIAQRVHRSKNSIKTRRRSIFDKLDVRSISEAISFAVNHKLI